MKNPKNASVRPTEPTEQEKQDQALRLVSACFGESSATIAQQPWLNALKPETNQ